MGSSAAFIMGALTFYSFQWQGLVLLAVFFLTSSFLTKWKREVKMDERAEPFEDKKGRTAGQVFANGGASTVAAVGAIYTADPIWLLMFAGAIATATADTWASEVGILSKAKPFHVKEWRKVEAGLSGAVTWLGTSAAILGAAAIGGSYYLLYNEGSGSLTLTGSLIIIFAGFAGNLADTFFGAWFEQKYYCQLCKTETESMWHCKKKTVRIFGLPWVTNNLVNFSSTIIGAFIAGGLYIWIVK
ncbi:DUF92 domain-containing protein [Fictibacillus phosphorivorans]|nr:DUF92 domain-containing protein [Fictibacillus phosphorivorans]MCM3774639.1 DUF92 domain-containing protein [Fictibacillus phosphorivorans]